MINELEKKFQDLQEQGRYAEVILLANEICDILISEGINVTQAKKLKRKCNLALDCDNEISRRISGMESGSC